MMTVTVKINERQIAHCTAVRIGGKGPGELCTYITQTGDIIHHWYDDGGLVLAKKLIEATIADEIK